MDSHLKILIIYFLAAVSLFSCDRYPQGPNKTLKKIRGAEIYVGLIHNPPFVSYAEGDTSGIEVGLIKEFAAQYQSKALWITGSEAILMDKLENFELHLIIGGLKKTTPYKTRIGITRPYHRALVMAIPQGENALLIELEKFLKSRQLQIRKGILNHD
jgi:polar amino acid transport system substrate-binding protein